MSRIQNLTLFHVVALLLFGVGTEAFGTHIPTVLDENILRPVTANEGYLSFHNVGPFGEERTGWTDVRHPANDGTNFAFVRNQNIGYDRSDDFVRVSNKVTTINMAVPGGGETATPDILRDYDFANEIWAQAGLSVLSTGVLFVDHSPGNPAGNNAITSPVNIGPPFPDDADNIQAQNRSAAPIVNNWYATNGLDNGGGVLRGVTAPPTNFAATSGTMIFDNAAPDTFAHELGHFLLDKHQFAGGSDHSQVADLRDLMTTGAAGMGIVGPRVLPTLAAKGDLNTSPRESGRPNGPNLGTVDHLNGKVALNAPPPPGGGITQIEAVNASAFVTHNINLPAGDRADFDWVEDNFNLEGIAGADTHAGADFLVRNIAPIGAPAHAGHDHDNWLGEATPPLPGGAYALTTFNQVDVVSQVARYTDMDINAANSWSRREAALDYLVQFSANGSTWVDGTPLRVFVRGWTDRSGADDYIARWFSPVAATQVRIGAKILDGHDGAAQIDAVIAIFVPEASTMALLAMAASAISLTGFRGRLRTST